MTPWVVLALAAFAGYLAAIWWLLNADAEIEDAERRRQS